MLASCIIIHNSKVQNYFYKCKYWLVYLSIFTVLQWSERVRSTDIIDYQFISVLNLKIFFFENQKHFYKHIYYIYIDFIKLHDSWFFKFSLAHKSNWTKNVLLHHKSLNYLNNSTAKRTTCSTIFRESMEESIILIRQCMIPLLYKLYEWWNTRALWQNKL